MPGKNVDLEQRNCRLNDGTKVTCVNIDVSMEYDGVGVPDSISKKQMNPTFLSMVR